jgi:hypothetical protein
MLVLLLISAITTGAEAQVSSQPNTSRPAVPAATTNMQPAPDVTGSLGKLNQVIENSRVDLARLRVEKWKADSDIKRQSQANADSIQRNLTSALPALVQQVRATPASIAATFKLYRNLNALYDVMSSLTESAGAFGAKEDYQALANDTANLDTLRRSLADQLERMAASRDHEVAQLQAQVRQQAATAAAAPPKKVIIDDNEPVKKMSAKKPATKKKATTANQEQNPPK